MIRVLIRTKGAGRALTLYYIDPATKREVTRSAGTNDRREAERAAALWEKELVTFRGTNGDGWDFFRRRFEDEHLIGKSRHTARNYSVALTAVRRLINPARISDVDTDALSRFQAALIREGKAMTSVRTYLRHIKAALNWAEFVRIIDRAPKVKLPPMGKHRFMKGRPLTEPEYRKMLAKCPEQFGDDAGRWQRFVTLLWLSGLRLEEATRLSWDTPPILIDLDARPYPLMIIHGEGQKSRQDEVVPLPPDLAAWLRMTPERDRSGLVAPLADECEGPCLNRVGIAISELGRAAGIVVNQDGKTASAHDFRRSFGTRWAKLVKPLTLQRLMRHSAIETTLRYYVGLSSDDAGADMYGNQEAARGLRAG